MSHLPAWLIVVGMIALPILAVWLTGVVWGFLDEYRWMRDQKWCLSTLQEHADPWCVDDDLCVELEWWGELAVFRFELEAWASEGMT